MKRIKDYILEERNVLGALRRFRQYAESHKQVITGTLLQRMGDIADDYERMRDFMFRGYYDAKRQDYYDLLLRKCYCLACDWDLKMKMASGGGAFWEASQHTQHALTSHDEIRHMLQSFVQNVAMLSLNVAMPDAVATDKRAFDDVYDLHYRQICQIFESLLIAPQWSSGDEKFYTELLLSPIIDINDARVLVSALMLAAMTEPDPHKISTLITIYQGTADEELRQRALVGIAFAMPEGVEDLFPEYIEMAQRLCRDENTQKQLLELQIQVFYCMNAERDNEAIRRDIMPGLMKNQPFRITRFGIEEKEDTSLDDILHPDAADQAMEELEESVQKMVDMQKAGVDIYFGGFSQMKRYSFFYTLCNWFTPFYKEHPALRSVLRKLPDDRLVDALLEHVSLCDSDKYSFALAAAPVFEKLPAELRETFEQRAKIAAVDVDSTEHRSAAIIRRSYLYDLYRFFNLYTQKASFSSPFNYYLNPSSFFFANPIFSATPLIGQMLPLARFLLKHRHYEELQILFEVENFVRDADSKLIEGLLAMQNETYSEAQEHFEEALRMQPENLKAMRYAAQAAFRAGNYETAYHLFQTLLHSSPEQSSVELNLAVTQICCGKIDEGVSVLYRLHFEQEDNPHVLRALAWGLLMKGQLDQATLYYDQLLANPISSDYLNAGYCQWLKGNIPDATQFFVKYVTLYREEGHAEMYDDDAHVKNRRRLLTEAFESDHTLFELHHVSDADQKLMIDLACTL